MRMMPGSSGSLCGRDCMSSLSLHPEKTRLIEFGSRAATKRERRGLAKPNDALIDIGAAPCHQQAVVFQESETGTY